MAKKGGQIRPRNGQKNLDAKRNRRRKGSSGLVRQTIRTALKKQVEKRVIGVIN